MKLKYLYNRIASLRKDLTILFWIALTSILLLDFWLKNKVEFFPGAHTLGDLYYKLCVSYISAFLFYFINVHLQSEKNKVKTAVYMHNKVEHINEICDNLIRSLRRSYVVGKDFDDIYEEINYLCKKIDMQSSFYFGGRYRLSFDNWFTGIDFVHKETKELLRDLLLIRDSLNIDVINVLIDIDNCLENFVNRSKGNSTNAQTLEEYSYGITKYKKLCAKLTQTFEEKT